MLEPIIKQEDITAKGMNGVTAGEGAHNAGEDRDSGQGLGQEPRLVSGLLGIEVECIAVRNHIHLVAGSAAIAATDNGRFVPLALEKSGQAADEGGLPGSAHGQVADRDDWNLHPVSTEDVPTVEDGAEPHDCAVEGAQGTSQEVHFFSGI